MASTMTTTDNGTKWLLEFTNVTTTTQSHLLATTNTFVDKDIRVTAKASAGAYSADSSSSTNSTVTPKLSNLHATATSTYGFITSLPSGVTLTNGTNYLLIDPDATATAWSVTPRAKITTAGYLPKENKNGTAVSQTPTIAGGQSYYIPIISGVTLAGGGLSTTTNKNEVTTPPKVTIASSGTFKSTSGYGVTTTKPSGTDGTDYLTIDGTGTPTNGKAKSTVKITKAAITYSNDAGVIAAHDEVSSNIGSTNSGDVTKEVTITPTVTDNFAPLYIPIRTVTYTTTVVNTTNNTITSRGTASISAGAIAQTTLPTATFAAQATSGQSYVDISKTSAAPVLTAGGYLFINKGYTDNLKIELAKLVPDSIADVAIATSAWIHPDYGAFGADGEEIKGAMTIYDGTYN